MALSKGGETIEGSQVDTNFTVKNGEQAHVLRGFGGSWTAAQVNAATFSVLLWQTTAAAKDLSIDQIRVTVWYHTTPEGGDEEYEGTVIIIQ